MELPADFLSLGRGSVKLSILMHIFLSFLISGMFWWRLNFIFSLPTSKVIFLCLASILT